MPVAYESILLAYTQANEVVRSLDEEMRSVLSNEDVDFYADTVVRMLASRCKGECWEPSAADGGGKVGDTSCEVASIALSSIATTVDRLSEEEVTDLALAAARRRFCVDAAKHDVPLCIAALVECLVSAMAADGEAGPKPLRSVFDMHPRDGLLLERARRLLVSGEACSADGYSPAGRPRGEFDLVVSMPPLNQGPWSESLLEGSNGAGRSWEYGTPPADKANFAWIEAALSELADAGRACLVVANDVIWTMRAEEADIKRRLVERNCVECVISLPSRLLPGSSLGVSVLVLAKSRARRSVLMIDAKDLSVPAEGTGLRALSWGGIEAIADAYGRWAFDDERFADSTGFCRSVQPEAIIRKKHLLAPELYVSARADGGCEERSLEAHLQALHALDERIAAATEELYGALGELGWDYA